MIWFLIHLALGFYLINMSMEFVTLPDLGEEFNSILIFIAGIFVIIGGVFHIKKKSKKGKGIDIKDLANLGGK